jgi:predicted DNA-binding protein (MmcQ/YjbR family)
MPPHPDLLSWALTLPGSALDYPWGETVVKVDGKVFVFLGSDPDRVRLSLKLPASMLDALEEPGAAPTGYGLGKSGWVSLDYAAEPPLCRLKSWIEESYRAVAKKRRVKELDVQRAESVHKADTPCGT